MEVTGAGGGSQPPQQQRRTAQRPTNHHGQRPSETVRADNDGQRQVQQKWKKEGNSSNHDDDVDDDDDAASDSIEDFFYEDKNDTTKTPTAAAAAAGGDDGDNDINNTTTTAEPTLLLSSPLQLELTLSSGSSNNKKKLEVEEEGDEETTTTSGKQQRGKKTSTTTTTAAAAVDVDDGSSRLSPSYNNQSTLQQIHHHHHQQRQQQNLSSSNSISISSNAHEEEEEAQEEEASTKRSLCLTPNQALVLPMEHQPDQIVSRSNYNRIVEQMFEERVSFLKENLLLRNTISRMENAIAEQQQTMLQLQQLHQQQQHNGGAPFTPTSFSVRTGTGGGASARIAFGGAGGTISRHGSFSDFPPRNAMMTTTVAGSSFRRASGSTTTIRPGEEEEQTQPQSHVHPGANINTNIQLTPLQAITEALGKADTIQSLKELHEVELKKLREEMDIKIKTARREAGNETGVWKAKAKELEVTIEDLQGIMKMEKTRFRDEARERAATELEKAFLRLNAEIKKSEMLKDRLEVSQENTERLTRTETRLLSQVQQLQQQQTVYTQERNEMKTALIHLTTEKHGLEETITNQKDAILTLRRQLSTATTAPSSTSADDPTAQQQRRKKSQLSGGSGGSRNSSSASSFLQSRKSVMMLMPNRLDSSVFGDDGNANDEGAGEDDHDEDGIHQHVSVVSPSSRSSSRKPSSAFMHTVTAVSRMRKSVALPSPFSSSVTTPMNYSSSRGGGDGGWTRGTPRSSADFSPLKNKKDATVVLVLEDQQTTKQQSPSSRRTTMSSSTSSINKNPAPPRQTRKNVVFSPRHEESFV